MARERIFRYSKSVLFVVVMAWLYAPFLLSSVRSISMRIPNSPLLALAACVWCCIPFVSVRATPNAFVFGDAAGYFLPIIFGTSPANYRRRGAVRNPLIYISGCIRFCRATTCIFGFKALNAAFIAGTALPAQIARRIVPVTFSPCSPVS